MKNRKDLVLKYMKLMIGFFLCALGLVTTINSNIGVSPWDVFHIGFSDTINITIGQASIVTGAIIILLNVLLKQTLGIATVANMVFIGLFTDIVIYLDFIPKILNNNWFIKIIMMLLGLALFSYGTFLYIIQGKGCGPRDGLMQILHQKTNISIGVIKNLIDIVAMVIGYILGGPIGIGTFIYALTIGFFIQFFFKIHKVDLKKVTHSTFKEEISIVKNVF
ncbi:YczE/YyaS/YitT family protein [Fusobacterium sp. PH5-44]|uniref:YczE/YyaS/YitT family protein n=1 Tax=unclassified Fusobacterium TaxID=2648384 RepID=UPI003D25C7BE